MIGITCADLGLAAIQELPSTLDKNSKGCRLKGFSGLAGLCLPLGFPDTILSLDLGDQAVPNLLHSAHHPRLCTRLYDVVHYGWVTVRDYRSPNCTDHSRGMVAKSYNHGWLASGLCLTRIYARMPRSLFPLKGIAVAPYQLDMQVWQNLKSQSCVWVPSDEARSGVARHPSVMRRPAKCLWTHGHFSTAGKS